MRALTLALLFTATPALADVAPLPCEGAEDGDTCTTEADEAGTCQDGTCVAQATQPENGCSTVGMGGAGAVVVGSLALLAIGRRRE
ncbi:MAG: hypothetical protein KC656_30690 [Myxococcales bacterium]|nr:hypothetical protein [Myxococcales bacterium]